jgi:GTP cyclohydrolase II
VASPAQPHHRNAIGSYSGSYSIYRALAVATRALAPDHRPDLTDTAPVTVIGPWPQWANPGKIVSLDPYGHLVGEVFAEQIRAGVDVRPTIAVTGAHINLPEIRQRIATGDIVPDGRVVLESGEIRVTKAAIDPVWYLPGIAERFGVAESELRRHLFEETGGMFPELVTRPDLELFLPPIGGQTVYLFGDVDRIGRLDTVIACRVHDECNGSDVFGSDICTCRPYLAHGVEVCAVTAQQGGVGLVVYNRKEGRALGEVTKFLVYNARKRQRGGDTAETYFQRTECVAGVPDMRFQELMPDVFHWLGIARIDRWVSMSNMKAGALRAQGIEIIEQVAIPDALVPPDARVEIAAKKAAGYFAPDGKPSRDELHNIRGRGLGA